MPSTLDVFTLRFDPRDPRLLYMGTGSLGLQAFAIAGDAEAF